MKVEIEERAREKNNVHLYCMIFMQTIIRYVQSNDGYLFLFLFFAMLALCRTPALSWKVAERKVDF